MIYNLPEVYSATDSIFHTLRLKSANKLIAVDLIAKN